LLHAVAHIELNAIDLAWDLIARFAPPGAGPHDANFYDDWVRVADEEATHHGLLAGRLAAYGAAYGDLPAHDGLWEAAQVTAHDLLARLAVVPMVLEARARRDLADDRELAPGRLSALGRIAQRVDQSHVQHAPRLRGSAVQFTWRRSTQPRVLAPPNQSGPHSARRNQPEPTAGKSIIPPTLHS
jgi:hypothetical protein